MKQLLLFLILGPLSIAPIFGQNEPNQSVFFDTDKAILRPEAQMVLKELAESARKKPQLTLRLQGNTDADGSDAHNLQLSERRTAAVRNFLINQGISAEKIKISALGKSKPLADNASADGKQRNRRVDISFESANTQTLSSSKTASPFEKGKSYHIMRLYKELGLTPQTFTVKSNRDTIIRGEKGTQLHFPANAFAGVAEGTSVEIKLKECYDYASILAENLTTKSDDKLLQTGGMIYVQATANGKELTLQKPMDIQFSSAESKLKGMELFSGERKMDKNGAMNWTPLRASVDGLELSSEANFDTSILKKYQNADNVYLNYYLHETTAPMSYIMDLTDTDSIFAEFPVYGKVVNPKVKYYPRSTSYAGNSMGVYACQYTDFIEKDKLIIHRAAFNDVYKFYKVNTYDELQKQDTSLWNQQYREKTAKMQAARIQAIKDLDKKREIGVLVGEVFKTNKLNYINCDRFVNYPANQLISLNVNDGGKAAYDSKVILKKDKVVLSGFAEVDKKINFGLVVKNVEAVIVAMKIENGQSYLAMHDFITSSAPIDLKFEALSPEEIKERLKTLN
jgi:hypothetical protein